MNCQKCKAENAKTYRYCNNCGSKLFDEPKDNYNTSVNKAKIFFFILLAYIGLLHVLKFESTYVTSLVCDIIFAVIVVVFFILNYRVILPLIISRITNFKLLFMVLTALIALAFLVSYTSDFLNHNVFNRTSNSYYEHYINSPFPLLFSIISIAVFPAIFEEIAFRGILFNELQ